VKRIAFLTVLVLCGAAVAACGPTAAPLPSATPMAQPPASPTAIRQATPSPEAAARYYEPEGGFSYVPPAGWALVDGSSSLAYNVVRGPLQDGFQPNLNVVDEPFGGSLEEYVAASLENMRGFFNGFRLVSQDVFQPEEGPAGASLVVENVQSGRALRQIFFFFDAGARKVVVTGTQLAGVGNAWDATFEGVARSFRFESE
jgi:hypothetical protein